MNCYQDEFDQTNGLRYLNHAAVALWPRRAADAVSAFARGERRPRRQRLIRNG